MDERIQKFTQLTYEYTEARNRLDTLAMEKAKQEIRVILCIPELAPALLIFISSLTPGTGASTARELLAEVLGYEFPSDPPKDRIQRDAGKYRRILAALWKWKKGAYPSNKKKWNSFQKWLRTNYTVIQEMGDHYGEEAYSSYFDEKTLRDFNEDLASFTNKTTAQEWTKIPDMEIWKRILAQGKGVFTGKLTARVDTITNNEGVLEQRKIPAIRFLLTVGAFEGARRVYERDMNKGKVPFLEPGSPEFIEKIKQNAVLNEERMIQDKGEYEALYPIDMDTFFDPDQGIVEIDTTERTPEQVVGYMLFIISQMLVQEPCEDFEVGNELSKAS